jgi:DNA-directed RNA polymerase subunit RPC12/RpoP
MSIWKEAKVNFRPTVDLFVCNECKVEFDLESKKIKNRPIFCPVCKKEIKAWQKDWET